MIQKETEFDFSKESRKTPVVRDWSKLIVPTINFTKKHKAWFILGITIFVAAQGVNYIFTDSPEQAKTKFIAMQTAVQTIPAMMVAFEKNKAFYDETVNYLISKEYEIPTNSMDTMQKHVQSLSIYNGNFKKSLFERINSLEIIDKKIKETKSFSLLTSKEKEFLLEEYSHFKTGAIYISGDTESTINAYTTVDYDDKPTEATKIKELQQMREVIKTGVSEIKKKSFKK